MGERTINQTTKVFPSVPFQWKNSQKIPRKGSFTHVHTLVGFLVRVCVCVFVCVREREGELEKERKREREREREKERARERERERTFEQ